MATGGSYEVDKKTGKEVLKSRTQDDHAEGKPAKKSGGKSK